MAGNYTEVNEMVYATTNVNIRAFDNAFCDKKGLLQSDNQLRELELEIMVGVG